MAEGDSEWIVDLLGYDLTRRYARVIPVDQLGITEKVDPLIRLAYTHDQRSRVEFFDQLFMTRVGRGVLFVSSLDHTESPGRWLLHKLITSQAKSLGRNYDLITRISATDIQRLAISSLVD